MQAPCLQKEICKMGQGSMVFIMGVQNQIQYKLLGRKITDGCDSYVVSKGGNRKERTHVVSRGNTMLWNKKKEAH